MMSTISPVFSTDTGLLTPVLVFETEFTPWDISQLFAVFDSSMNITPDYVNSGLVNRTGLEVSSMDNTDDRRKKRKLSNRESAKRSRVKKQKHLEEMNVHVNQLKIENRELANQFRNVLYHCQRTKTENDHLRLEHRILQDKLSNLRQVLMFLHIERSSNCATWPCDNGTVVTVHQDPLIIANHVI